MSISIQPSIVTTTKIITSFTVNVLRLDLFQSVTVNAMLYGTDGTFIEVKTITLSGQDYQKWDNNDQYLINKIAEILGLTLIIPPQSAVPQPAVPEPYVPQSDVPQSDVPQPAVPEPSVS